MGNWGNYPYLCGTNHGLHCKFLTTNYQFLCYFCIEAYIDLSCDCGDEAKIAITLGDTTNNVWKIKVVMQASLLFITQQFYQMNI